MWCLQETTTWIQSTFSINIFYNTLLSNRKPSKSPLSFRCLNQSPVWILLSATRVPCPSGFYWFDNPSHIEWGVQIIKLLNKQSSTVPCYFALLGPKHLYQRPVSKHLHYVTLSITFFLSKRQNESNYGYEYIKLEIGLTTYVNGPPFSVTFMLVDTAILTNTRINPPTCWTIWNFTTGSVERLIECATECRNHWRYYEAEIAQKVFEQKETNLEDSWLKTYRSQSIGAV